MLLPSAHGVRLVGDGGGMFTLAELATAVEERPPVVILLWHNAGYEEIRRYMDAHGVERLVRNDLWKGRGQDGFYDALQWLYGWSADSCLATD